MAAELQSIGLPFYDELKLGSPALNDTEETPERELHAVNSIASCKQAGAHI